MTEDELQTRVIENIRTLRKKVGLSQEKLADKADISRQMMNDIEGRRRWLTKSTLVKLVNAMNADVHEFFLPAQTESDAMRNTYDVVTQKVVAQGIVGARSVPWRYSRRGMTTPKSPVFAIGKNAP